jgi:hypothetical protein
LNPGRGKLFFSSPKTSRPALWPTQCLNQWVARVLPRGKASGREVNHSSPSSAEVKNKWIYTSSHSVYLHGVDRENFTFIRYDCAII